MPRDYKDRVKARLARLDDRADKARDEAASRYKIAHKMADAIPFGQPVLVGHHSEGRDCRYRERIRGSFEKSFEAQKKAEVLDARAASVGTGGISSDDPEAVAQLQAEVDAAEALQARMIATNRAVRKKDPALLVALGYSEKIAAALLEPDCLGRVGFADYQLKNNNANVRRMKERIAELTARAARPSIEVVVEAPGTAPAAGAELQSEGYTYREDANENRVMFRFPGKPSEEIRAVLKSHAFKWSPNRDAWVRQLTGSGRYAGQCVHKRLTEMLAG